MSRVALDTIENRVRKTGLNQNMYEGMKHVVSCYAEVDREFNMVQNDFLYAGTMLPKTIVVGQQF